MRLDMLHIDSALHCWHLVDVPAIIQQRRVVHLDCAFVGFEVDDIDSIEPWTMSARSAEDAECTKTRVCTMGTFLHVLSWPHPTNQHE